ncbi:hypothetical protein NP233_g3332 [Leucocoprinus birnbaumii]|uniref:F-box domain-containing protein n=1 Tax=Leucocoprinus birnbaumii TaxID=56174 RepID=A0AAD5VY40_9AGAR|nr:hypothetical protein NP233_g3332 [Leucocoprinus birnbaumii]
MDQEHRWRPRTPLKAGVFDALPDLVLQRIIHFLLQDHDTKYLKRFRQTSKRICSLVNPHLFDWLYLEGTDRPLPKAHLSSMITGLLSGQAGVLLEHVKKLEIYSVPVTESPSASFDRMNVLIRRLQNVYAIKWFQMLSSHNNSIKAVDYLVQTFGLLSNLRVLSLALSIRKDGSITELSLQPISNLHVLNIEWLHKRPPHPGMLSQVSELITRSPDLERFSFVIPHATPLEKDFSPPVTLGEILVALNQFPSDLRLKSLETRGVIVSATELERHVRHFKSLVDIRIRFDPSPSAATNVGGLLSMLAMNNINLKKIHVDKIHHPGVFAYLSSHPGIEDLSLKPGHHLDDSPEILERFFMSVLPAQAVSLKRLRLGGNFNTRWSRPLSAEYLDEVAKCRRLEYICCWVLIDLGNVDANESGNLLSWLSTALRLPNLRCFKCPPMTLMRRQFNATQAIAFKPEHYDRNPDPTIRAHLTRLVEGFEATSSPFFDIDITYTKGF